MIHLMLNANCQQTIHFKLKQVAVAIQRADFAHYSARGKARCCSESTDSLLLYPVLATFLQQFRVNEYPRRSSRFFETSIDDPLVDIDLRCGQTDTFFRVHRFEHIIDDTLNFCIHFFNRHATLREALVGVYGCLQNDIIQSCVQELKDYYLYSRQIPT